MPNPFRVQAYRRAAVNVRHSPKPLDEIWRAEGDAGLRRVTGIGERLGSMLRTLVTTGRLPILDRLRGETDPLTVGSNRSRESVLRWPSVSIGNLESTRWKIWRLRRMTAG